MNLYPFLFSIYRFYRTKIRTQREFPYPSLSVGSLFMGGAGKTILTMEIIDKFKEKYKIALLTRGYVRKKKEDLVVRGKGASPKEIGDEACLYTRKFEELIIGIGRRREKLAEKIIEKMGKPDFFILDDAHQYLRFKFSLSVLVLRENFFLRKNSIKSLLREDYKGIKRSDCIVIKLSTPIKQIEKYNEIMKKFNKPFYYMNIKLREFENFYKDMKFSLEELKNENLFAFCGIGDPQGFFSSLKELKVKKRIVFKDHYYYKKTDIEQIDRERKKIHSKWVITTEKDIVRIENPPFNFLYPVLEVSLSPPDFWNFINEKLCAICTSS